MSESSIAVAGAVVEVVLPGDIAYAKEQAVLSAQYAAAAQVAAQAAAASAQGRIYASQGAGEAATTTGQYFFVAAAGVYDLYVRTGGGSTKVTALPTLDLANGQLSVAANAAIGTTGAPSNTAGFNRQLLIYGGLPCLTLEGTTGARKFSLAVNSVGSLACWDNNASADRWVLTAGGDFGLGTTAPANSAGYNRQLQITGGLPCLTLDGSTGNRKYCLGVASSGAFSLWDNNAAADRLRITTAGAVLPGGSGQNFGGASDPWNNSYFAVSPTITSDRRAKTDIEPIGAALLDAWADVEWVRYRLISDDSPHVGLIAQQVFEALDAHGIDAVAVGLVTHQLYDAVPAVEEVRDEAGDLVRAAQPGRPAGDVWMLRYSECEAMEAAWQRRENALIGARLAALEAAA